MKNEYINYENDTFTTDEILEVTTNEYERWRGIFEFKAFRIRRDSEGRNEDTYEEDDQEYMLLDVEKVGSVAHHLYHRQLAGMRLKYTPKGLRALMLQRSLFPTEITRRSDGYYNAHDTQEHLSEKEFAVIEAFLATYEEADKLVAMRYDDQLKWATDDSQFSMFASEAKCLAGQRMALSITRYLQQQVPHAGSDVIRDLAAELTAMHHNNDRYQVHIAEGEQEIIAVYENSNVPSCMVRARSENETIYITSSLEEHPVVAYDAPDIEVIGLWDTVAEHYVARAVTRLSRKQYHYIYPTDHSGMRGKVVAKLEAWLDRSGYTFEDSYLDGAKVKYVPAVVSGDELNAICMPYIDGTASSIAICDATRSAVLYDSRESNASDQLDNADAFPSTNTCGMAGYDAADF